jgi:hypothetical protein
VATHASHKVIDGTGAWVEGVPARAKRVGMTIAADVGSMFSFADQAGFPFGGATVTLMDWEGPVNVFVPHGGKAWIREWF